MRAIRALSFALGISSAVAVPLGGCGGGSNVAIPTGDLGSAAQGAAPTDRFIVVFDTQVLNDAAQQGLLRRFDAQDLGKLTLIGGRVVLLPPPAAQLLAQEKGVSRVEKDLEIHALPKPTGPGGKKGGGGGSTQPPQSIPWGVDRIDAEAKYTGGTGRGLGVNVAVIDTGIDASHPDLSVTAGVNFVPSKGFRVNPDQWGDQNGHGTHVAGTIAALDNAIGVVGVAPAASLYAVRVLDRNGSGRVSDLIKALGWCADNTHKMQVANMSLGLDADVTSLGDACDAARAQGVILVAAAGNDGSDVDYPGAYGSVIPVAAVDRNDGRPSWSSWGPPLAANGLGAPGVDVPSTWLGGGYNTISGTSMAAPHVTGAIALELSAHRIPDPCVGADQLGAPDHYGCGLVDAQEAATGFGDGDNLP